VADQSAFTLLNRHYRCVPEIIAFCSNALFYGGQVPGLDTTGAPPPPWHLPRCGFRVDNIAAAETRYRASSASKSALNTQEADGAVRATMEPGEIGTIHTFQGAQQTVPRGFDTSAQRAQRRHSALSPYS
jgi:hypothetical protein